MTPHISVSLLGTQSDERLASLAGSGHERAFEAIVERYSKALTRYAQRFLGEARAEEVVQAAFLSAWSALTTGTEVRDLRPWLYRIVHNGALNAMNRSESGDLELIEATDGALSPHAILEQNEEVRSALNVIAELPERQRAALLAVAVEGRAHADVAVDLGVSDAGVRQLVRRARVQVRTAVTALTPLPLALWLADAQRGPSPDLSHRIAEILADGGGNALAGSAMKASAIVVSVAAVATAAPKVSQVVEKDRKSEPAAAIVRASAAGANGIASGGPPALIPDFGLGGNGSGQRGGQGGQDRRGESPNEFGTAPGGQIDGGQMSDDGGAFEAPAGQRYDQEFSSLFTPQPTVREPGGRGRGGNSGSGNGGRGGRNQPTLTVTPTPTWGETDDSGDGGTRGGGTRGGGTRGGGTRGGGTRGDGTRGDGTRGDGTRGDGTRGGGNGGGRTNKPDQRDSSGSSDEQFSAPSKPVIRELGGRDRSNQQPKYNKWRDD